VHLFTVGNELDGFVHKVFVNVNTLFGVFGGSTW
jgi:hypothetical protein